MDIDSTEDQEALTRADGREGTWRCGWIALGLIILLIPGVAPVGFLFGVMGRETVADAVGRTPGQDLIGRLIVLAGMTAGILLLSVILLFLAVIVHRIAHGLARRISFAARKPVL
jgi:hypothetical protein